MTAFVIFVAFAAVAIGVTPALLTRLGGEIMHRSRGVTALMAGRGLDARITPV